MGGVGVQVRVKGEGMVASSDPVGSKGKGRRGLHRWEPVRTGSGVILSYSFVAILLSSTNAEGSLGLSSAPPSRARTEEEI